MKNITYLLTVALMALGMTACQKDKPTPDDNPTGNPDSSIVDPLSGVALVLNEGSWGANEASISLLHNWTTGEMTNDWFRLKNGRGLGDVAQDMVAYGTKIYVTVWGSNSLEVIDRNSSRAKHISLGDRGPRYIATHNGKLYITCYTPNSVIRVDTATLSIEATCLLGDYNPEGIAISNGKIFVASQKMGLGNNEFQYDNKVYVIDAATFANPSTVTVGTNPDKVKVYNDQYVVVNCFGNYVPSSYSYVDPKVAFINTQTNDVKLYDYALNEFDVYNNSVYGFYTSPGNNIYVTLSGDPLHITYSTGIMESGVAPFKINIHPTTGDRYLTTTGNYTEKGDVLFTSYDKTLTWSSQAGMLPSKIVFL